MKARQTGFTLVEIAIVLVIIGLLLGGILKGQEMITQAKIKNVINDLNGITAALNSFQDRYRTLPGDDKGAATRWSSDATVANGDGDGVISGKWNTTTATDETAQFWLHLRKAGFISGTGTDVPFNALSGKMGVQTGNGPAATVTPTAVMATVGPPAIAGFTGLIMCSANLPDKMAISVDAQVDDGNAQTGGVRGVDQAGVANPLPAATLTAGYVEDGTKSYLVCRTLI